jgi:hypothetical protein
MKVLPDRHTLAGSLKISLEKLANEVGVLKSQHTAGSLNGFTLFCTRASFSTRVINEPATSHAALTMVAKQRLAQKEANRNVRSAA